MNSWPSLAQIFESSAYDFNLHAVPVFLAAILILWLGLRILILKRERMHIHFFVLCLAIFVWLFATGMGYLASNPFIARAWFRLDWIGVSFISAGVFGFTESLLGKKRSIMVTLGYLIAAFFSLLTAVFNPLMGDLHRFYWGYYPLRSSIGHTFFLIFFFGYMGLAFFRYVETYRAVTDHLKKAQLKHIFVAFLVAYLGAIDFLPTFGINCYPFGFIFIVLFIVISAYAIESYGLLDIHGLVRKTVVYSVISAALLAVYVGFVLLIARMTEGYLSRPSLYVSTVGAGLVAMLFHPLQVLLQSGVDRYFPRESLNQTLLREATSTFVHEIKRPLMHITLPAELALADLAQLRANGTSDEEIVASLEKRLRFIAEKSVEAGKMIEAIRELASETPLPIMISSVRSLVESVLDSESEGVKRGQVHVMLGIDSSLQVYGHESQLRIVFANLIKNSLDSMALRPVDHLRELSISARQVDGRIKIVITDTGVGIPWSDRARLFDPWFTTKGSRGMGVGLFLSREILRRHNASIEVDSYKDAGASFHISFPVVLP